MNKTLFLLYFLVSQLALSQTLNYNFKNLRNSPTKIVAFTAGGKDLNVNNSSIKFKKYVYNLNDKGNFLHQKIYKKSGDLSYWMDYKYDDSNNLISATFRYGDSSLNYISVYEYDTHERLIRNLMYTKSDTILVDYSYQEKEENLVRHKIFRVSGDSSLVFLDLKNNVLKSIYTKNGKQNGFVENDYDKQNNLICYKKFDKHSNLVSQTETKYDAFGNFINRKSYSFKKNKKILISEENQKIIYDNFNNPIKKIQRNENTNYVYIELFEYFY